MLKLDMRIYINVVLWFVYFSTWRAVYQIGGALFITYIFMVHLLYIFISLRKHAYSNILKISPPKTENFQIKKL